MMEVTVAVKTMQEREYQNLLKKSFKSIREEEDNLCDDLEDWFDYLSIIVVNHFKENNGELHRYEVEQIVSMMTEDFNDILEKHITHIYTKTIERTDDITSMAEKRHITNTVIQHTTIHAKKWKPNKPKISRQTVLDTFLTPFRKIRTIFNKPAISAEWSLEEQIIEFLESRTFIASESTLARVTDKIYKIIQKEMEEGNGVITMAERIKEQFTELSFNEARRIARTESHRARSNSNHNRLVANDVVEYTRWMATLDEVTRESHEELDGEITYADGTGIYSNGLMFPGDESGDIEEWINCRCTEVAYFPEVGLVPPPDADNWREEDMVRDFSIIIPDLEVEVSIL